MGDKARYVSDWPEEALRYDALRAVAQIGIGIQAACDLLHDSGSWWFVVVADGDVRGLALRAYEAFDEAGLPRRALRTSFMIVRPTSPLGKAVLAFAAARGREDFYDFTQMGGHTFEAYRLYDPAKATAPLPAPAGGA
ncbi:MAG: hypothetical protein ACRC33_07715 [Gemmataceae bacterium]